ncbi:MAG: acylphosphatase [Methanosarcinales archaeon]|nr:acylphosphatase [Methanosarcinales archaeon]
MQTQIKRYTVTIRGKVQHIGYRNIIEGTARKLDIKGYIFNDVDNSVKMVCEGLQKSIDTFLENLTDFARADIDAIDINEIYDEIPLPHTFSRVATDEYYEFSGKFDIGLDYLEGIKTDTGEMKSSLNQINNTLEFFVTEQRGHNQWMKEHLVKMDERNQRLDTILEKLVEK